jgi:hypothetical protein
MRPHTSREAWAAIQSGLPFRRWQALQWVQSMPGKTAAELEAASGLRHLNKRLSELQRQGVVETRGTKESTTSGMAGVRWWPTGAQRPLPLPKKPTRQQLEKELAALRSEVVRLRHRGLEFIP